MRELTMRKSTFADRERGISRDRAIETERLSIRPWAEGDAAAALAIYGDTSVTNWLSPVFARVPDEPAMRATLRKWRDVSATAPTPLGHWAVVRSADGVLVGGLAIRTLETADDLEIAWQLAPAAWGHGYAVEAGQALARWALGHSGVEELFALVRPSNRRGLATAARFGMDWVGETDKFHGMRLQVFRVREADLAPVTVVAGRDGAPPLVPPSDPQ